MLSEKPWRAEAVFIFILAQAVCFLLGGTTMALLHKAGVAGFKGDNDFGNILLGTLSLQGTTCILMVLFFKLHGVRVSEGLGLRNKNLLRSLLLALVVIVVVLPIAYSLGGVSITLMEKIGWVPKDEEAVSLVTNATSRASATYLGFFAVVLAPVAEEFIFRGMLFPFIKQRGYPKTAWAAASLLFALAHVSAPYFVSLFVLALALTWLYEKTDTLLAPIFAHALFNAAGLILIDCFPQWTNSNSSPG
jgi:membrane protease YdiL (CAAX protease family)